MAIRQGITLVPEEQTLTLQVSACQASLHLLMLQEVMLSLVRI